MDIKPALRYLKYFLFSRHRKGHGIHSPFVFNLVSQTFRNKIEPDIVFNIEKVRRKMISDQRSIVVNDLGAGSKKMKNSLRKVSDIARYSSVPKKFGNFLYNMSGTFGKPLVIELGTSLGISTMYLAAAVPDAKVYTIEGCRATSEIASSNFSEASFSNIELFNGSFEEVLPQIKKENIAPGLVYIDGNHRKEPVLRYFDQIAEMADNNTVVIIDDIYDSTGMAEAWEEIKKNDKVTCSIDIFRMGIVFFRKGISRIHYVIRY